MSDEADDTEAEALAEPWITEPGIYRMSPEQYHADPVVGRSVSSTALRMMLPPQGCPAKARHYLDHPTERHISSAMEFGSAAHNLVLGETTKVIKMDVENWRSPADREERDAHQAAGRVVIKASDWPRVEALAEAIQADPWASALLSSGEAEVVLVWRDEPTGLMVRAMFDRLAVTGTGTLPWPDYKTTPDASPDAFGKSVDRFAYHQQIELYSAGIRAVMPDRDPHGFLVAQEVDPPHLVQVYPLDPVARRVGQARNRWALDLYAQCVADSTWPGYVESPHDLSLPRWAEIREGVE